MATALLSAVTSCRFKQVRLLLRQHLDPNVKSVNGQSVLVTALFIENAQKREKMFKYLLDHGATCDAVDFNGMDVLSWASHLGYDKQVQCILRHMAGDLNLQRKDNNGRTALHHCSMEGNVECVKLLAEALGKFHLSLDVTDDENLTPYLEAARHGHKDILAVLLQGGASKSQFGGRDRYMSAYEWERVGRREREKRTALDRQRQDEWFLIGGRLPQLMRKKRLSSEDGLSLPTVKVTGVDNKTEQLKLSPNAALNRRAAIARRDRRLLGSGTIAGQRQYTSLPNIAAGGPSRLHGVSRDVHIILETVSMQATHSFRPHITPLFDAKPICVETEKKQRKSTVFRNPFDRRDSKSKGSGARAASVIARDTTLTSRVTSSNNRRYSQPPTRAPNAEKLVILDKRRSCDEFNLGKGPKTAS